MTGRRYRVIAAYEAAYADPIRIRPGDSVRFTGEKNVWEGHTWLWAVAGDGREGWVPDNLPVSQRGDGWISRAAYSAVELSCRESEVLEGLAQTHGWIFCRNTDGAEGWVPCRNLVAVEAGEGGRL